MIANIFSQLQYDQRDSLVTTNQSLETLQTSSEGHTTTLSTIETQTTQISVLTGATNQTLATLTTEVQQINNNFRTLVPTIQNLQHQCTPQSELSALESMLESAVMRGMKRHHEELQKCQPTLLPPLSESLPEGHFDTLTGEPRQHLCSKSYAMIRRDKIVFRTAFRTPFFDIEIKTKEAQRIPKSKKGTSCHEISQLKPNHSLRSTTYKVRVKIPFWRGGMTYHSGNAGMMYGGRFCKTFRTNDFVPYDAPIIKACKNFDLTEVRRLFEAGLASPLDLNHSYNRTLVDIVVWHLVFGIHFEPSIQVGAAISLWKYLIHCLNDDIGAAHGIPDMFFFLRQHSYSKNAAAALEEACRILLIHCSDDPLEGLAEFLTIPASGSSLYQILVAQDIWWIDDKVEYKTSADVKYWVETDLQMLRDPGGNTLKAALKKGCVYRPHNSINKILVGETLHGLLVIASETVEEKFHHCIYSRLVIMIQHGLDPRGISFIQADYGLVPLQLKRTMRRPLSCTEYAQFLGLETLWARSLAGAGWSTADMMIYMKKTWYLPPQHCSVEG